LKRERELIFGRKKERGKVRERKMFRTEGRFRGRESKKVREDRK
jgi:hypothetical protein